MIYHVPDNDDAIDRTYGARPKTPTKPIGKCERCGSDRFVRKFKNGTLVCITCIGTTEQESDLERARR
jgi:hypothetical protein